MRAGIVDIGTNSTRLLVADVTDAGLVELERESTVTRLGEGVDATGRLGEEPMNRVFATLERYRAAIDAHRCERTVAVLTSAVRDAANGAEFTETVGERFGLDARTIAGVEEAQLSYLGATSERDPSDPTPLLLVDIGGGSTEFVLGSSGAVCFDVSTQAGVVRQTERHIRNDPPEGEELQALADEVRGIIEAEVPAGIRERAGALVGVAGTATSCAAIDQELEPYDPHRVHGYRLTAAALELILARLASMDLEERREVPGLHPDRAPTIVAGVVILVEVLRAVGLDELEISEHDILHGAALQAARA